MKKIILFLTVSCIFSLSFSQNKTEIKNWLKSGSVKINKPAFANTEDINGKTFENADLLKNIQIDISQINPKITGRVKIGTYEFPWESISIANDSIVSGNVQKESIMLLACYISVDRWTDLKIKLSTNALYELYIDNSSEDDEGLDFWVDRKRCLEKDGEGLNGLLGLPYKTISEKFYLEKTHYRMILQLSQLMISTSQN